MVNIWKAVFLGLLTGITGLVVSLILFRLIFDENVDIDMFFKLRGQRQPPHDVIIVNMDKFSADKLSLPYDLKKWPRSYHARLTDNLVRAGAVVIAFDVMFNETRSTEDDNLFARAISKAGNVVLCEKIKKEKAFLTDEDGSNIGNIDIERVVQPIPTLKQSSIALAPFPIPKVPLKVSQYWTFKISAGNIPSLPIVVFQIFTLNDYDDFIKLLKKFTPSLINRLPEDKDEIINTKGVIKVIQIIRDIFEHDPQIAEKMLEELHNSKMLSIDVKKSHILKSLIRMYQSPKSQYLNFYGPPHTITTVPYYNVLNLPEQLVVNKKHIDFNGKAVFVGSSEHLYPEQRDGFKIVFSPSKEFPMSGVEIAATAFANLYENTHIQPLRFYAYLGIIFLWGVIIGIFCYLFSTVITAVSVIGVSVIYLTITLYQFTANGILYPLSVPLFCQAPMAFLGGIICRYNNKKNERQNKRKRLGYYLPDVIVDQLPNDINQKVYGTCLYSSLFETIDSNKLKSLIKKCYKVVCAPVKQHGGTITNVKENPITAIWMTSDADPRKEAYLSALDIDKALHRYNQSSSESWIPTRIGMHYGRILLNNIGAEDHYEYCSVEDIIDTAKTIDKLNKHLGVRILLSEEMLNHIDCFLTRELGKFLLIDRAKPIAVHELMCRKEDSNHMQKSLCELFSYALDAFKRQSWEEASEKFYEIIKRFGEDSPSLFYVKLCKQYRNKSFEESWDGVVCIDKNYSAF
ncbi:MAG: CHASE2 domain-containing protein [Candidatus Scalinduaceae bacterium]